MTWTWFHNGVAKWQIQYNTIQYNTIQYNTIQYNTIQYNTITFLFSQYNANTLRIETYMHKPLITDFFHTNWYQNSLLHFGSRSIDVCRVAYVRARSLGNRSALRLLMRGLECFYNTLHIYYLIQLLLCDHYKTTVQVRKRDCFYCCVLLDR